MKDRLRDIAARCETPVERRLLAEYGAVFVTQATPPPTILFQDAAEVEGFQASLRARRATVGAYEMELQAEAMAALLSAVAEGGRRGATIAPRAADAARRSYEETVGLWRRNVGRGLDHWQREGRLDEERAGLIRALEPAEQVAVILEAEEREGLYFGTFFNRSILYSVAAPGASQHLSMLAFDVADYQDDVVRTSLNEHGWHRTVIHDLPHFTYLGWSEGELPQLGLKPVAQEVGGQEFRFWVPEDL